MVVYSVLFGIISFSLTILHTQQPYLGYMILSIIVLIYTILVKNEFFHKRTSTKHS